MELMRLKDIGKIYKTKYNETVALHDVDLIVNKKDLIAITGPSGCGKSTLMNILGLIDKQTKGEYILKGKNTSNLGDKESSILRNKEIGFIYQHFALINELNLLENVIIPLNIRKMSDKDKKENGKKYLKKVGLEGLERKYPYELSGGQQQRVAIARALAQETDIILADEPTGNLDEKNSEEILKLLIELNNDGKTVVVITHDNNIAKHCKKIIKMKDGKII
ncbi:ABC transporter ATP-binding protein [Clostridium thermobutyricum]|uniref:Lipoprotein-releasing system ATP-binding protein LolD n=1 Tax=Clostridium thermobutyricum DSM 4928 TaxID=1121339 RepID=A0A1V4SX59_9CLOT|nr:ABC transporter ATP-binding protein [Clostridium thermobutyricum]OPX49117.1 lipoprotein-releasing system ATP-binding protein LolD [Clostridium thermobutyricum DSM 4928]